jgi:hypothetical protein
MRGFLGFVALVAAILLTVGFWRGWFLVDRERIRDDTDKAVEKVQKTTDNLREPSPRDSRDKVP